MNIQRIVVGVDGSVPSRAAIRWAAEEAIGLHADLVLAHVVDDEWGTVSARMIDEVGDGTNQLIEAEQTYALQFAPDLTIRTRALRGSPMWQLAALSDAVTMIAVGTHKSGFHYGRAFGSRSLQLANLAAGVVAVIPESTVRFRRGVVAGVDPTPAGWEALDHAADEAERRQAELTLVRACAPARSDGFGDAYRTENDDLFEQTARTDLAAAVDRVKTRCPNATIRSRVVRRPAGAALNELARTAEMLVIGDSRRPGAQPGTLGSVAYDVLLNLTCPTMVVHATNVPTDDGAADVSAETEMETKGLNHVNR